MQACSSCFSPHLQTSPLLFAVAAAALAVFGCAEIADVALGNTCGTCRVASASQAADSDRSGGALSKSGW